MKKFFTYAAALTMSFLLIGCGNEVDNPTGATQATQAVVEQTTAEQTTTAQNNTVAVNHEGLAQSVLTGEWIDPEIAARRPLAIMINNIEDADPQSGIDRAEIMYEAYVESDITRMMMILQDYDDMSKIGPVRSCREFYVYFAKEFDAIYVHFGFSPLAATLLDSDKVEHLDGMKMDGSVFYRTTDRVAPHNAYTSSDKLLEKIESLGWSSTISSDFDAPLNFNADETNPIVLTGGADCTVFKPGFKRNKPVFTYNAEDGLYYREQYGRAHCDMESGQQLAFKNILVKFVSGTKYTNGTPILDLMGEGPAYYITDGKLVQVKWVKETEFGPTKYYYNSGEELVLNQGKTFINVITMDDADDVEYY
jgi:hypothetical protein